MANQPVPQSADWPQAMATVTACTYTAGAGPAMAFGLSTSRHFLIAYNYFVDDVLHTGEFASKKAVPQGTLFPLAYNPNAPHENEKSTSFPTSRSPILAVGIIGSVILSLAWLLVLRSCH